jgi:hypothetical protein
MKLISRIRKLPAEYILLDLGAGKIVEEICGSQVRESASAAA